MILKNRNKGFTFIELILYMAILGIFMVAVMSIISTTVASHKKQSSRQKIQTQATETYDAIADIVMGASDIADIKTFGGVDASKDEQTFIDADYLWVQYSSELDKTAFCTIKYSKTDKKLYISRQEMSDEDIAKAKQDLKSSDPTKVNAAQATLSSCTQYVDSSSQKGTVLANNVASFQLQVNPDDNSLAVIIGFEDEKTNEKYKVTSVVGLRNSFVLKKHEWD